ncbi:hypothetical protein BLNAU_2411 [Blattamonas nauphoetae]|uniref:Dynein heavy chain n=1 Tax=Blattamonas nauphoetae TaxID=2049346 RepID=A0ABQ9YFN0_9EUKA|nr:hypothetical protein BLNAU_2411 [Blattamonas nauphoetae]
MYTSLLIKLISLRSLLNQLSTFLKGATIVSTVFMNYSSLFNSPSSLAPRFSQREWKPWRTSFTNLVRSITSLYTVLNSELDHRLDRCFTSLSDLDYSALNLPVFARNQHTREIYLSLSDTRNQNSLARMCLSFGIGKMVSLSRMMAMTSALLTHRQILHHFLIWRVTLLYVLTDLEKNCLVTELQAVETLIYQGTERVRWVGDDLQRFTERCVQVWNRTEEARKDLRMVTEEYKRAHKSIEGLFQIDIFSGTVEFDHAFQALEQQTQYIRERKLVYQQQLAQIKERALRTTSDNLKGFQDLFTELDRQAKIQLNESLSKYFPNLVSSLQNGKFRVELTVHLVGLNPDDKAAGVTPHLGLSFLKSNGGISGISEPIKSLDFSRMENPTLSEERQFPILNLIDHLVDTLLSLAEVETTPQMEAALHPLATEAILVEQEISNFLQRYNQFSTLWTESPSKVLTKLFGTVTSPGDEQTIPLVPPAFVTFGRLCNTQTLPRQRSEALHETDSSDESQRPSLLFTGDESDSFSNPPYSLWKSTLSVLTTFNKDIAQSAFVVDLGWVMINMSTLKRDLVSLLSDWIYPLQHFLEENLNKSMDQAHQILNTIKTQFDGSFVGVDILNQITITNTARLCQQSFGEMNNYIHAIFQRLIDLKDDTGLSIESLRRKATGLESLWKLFETVQWKNLEHHIQIKEDEIMPSIHQREHALEQELKQLGIDFHDPDMSPLRCPVFEDAQTDASHSHAQGQLQSLRQRLNTLIAGYDEIDTLWQSFGRIRLDSNPFLDEYSIFLANLEHLWRLVCEVQQFVSSKLLPIEWARFEHSDETIAFFSNTLDETKTIELPNDTDILSVFQNSLSRFHSLASILSRLKKQILSSTDWNTVFSHIGIQPSTASQLTTQAMAGTLPIKIFIERYTTSMDDKLVILLNNIDDRSLLWEDLKQILTFYSQNTIPKPDRMWVWDKPSGDESFDGSPFSLVSSTPSGQRGTSLGSDRPSTSFPFFTTTDTSYLGNMVSADCTRIQAILTLPNTEELIPILDLSMNYLTRVKLFFDSFVAVQEIIFDLHHILMRRFGVVSKTIHNFLSLLGVASLELSSLQSFIDPDIVEVTSTLSQLTSLRESIFLFPPYGSIPPPSDDAAPADLCPSTLINTSRSLSQLSSSLVRIDVISRIIPGVGTVLYSLSKETDECTITHAISASRHIIALSNPISFSLGSDVDVLSVFRSVQDEISSELKQQFTASWNDLSQSTLLDWISRTIPQTFDQQNRCAPQTLFLCIQVWYGMMMGTVSDRIENDRFDEAILVFSQAESSILSVLMFLMSVQRSINTFDSNFRIFHRIKTYQTNRSLTYTNRILSHPAEKALEAIEAERLTKTVSSGQFVSDFYGLEEGSMDEDDQDILDEDDEELFPSATGTWQVSETDDFFRGLISSLIRVVVGYYTTLDTFKSAFVELGLVESTKEETVNRLVPPPPQDDIDSIKREMKSADQSLSVSLVKVCQRETHIQLNPNSTIPVHILPESDISLDQNEDWEIVPHAWDWFPGLKALPSFPLMRSTYSLVAALRCALVDANSTHSVVGPCLFPEEASFSTAEATYRDIFIRLGVSPECFTCSPLHTPQLIREKLFSSFVSGRVLVLDHLELLEPSVRRLVVEMLQKIQTFKKSARQHPEGSLLFEMSELKALVRVPLAPSCVLGTFVVDQSFNGHIPDRLDLVFRCMTVPQLDPTECLQSFLLEEGFCIASELSARTIQCLDALIQFLHYTVAEDGTQTSTYVHSFSFLQKLAQLAGKYLRNEIQEVKDDTINTQTRPDPLSIHNYQVLLHYPLFYSIPNLFPQVTAPPDIIFQIHTIMEEKALKHTLFDTITELYDMVSSIGFLKLAHLSSKTKESTAVPSTMDTFNNIISSFFPSPLDQHSIGKILENRLGNQFETMYISVSSRQTERDDHNAISLKYNHASHFTDKLQAFIIQNQLTNDTVFLHSSVAAFDTLRTSSQIVLNGYAGSGKTTIIRAVKSFFEAEINAHIAIVDVCINKYGLNPHQDVKSNMNIFRNTVLRTLQSLKYKRLSDATRDRIDVREPLHSVFGNHLLNSFEHTDNQSEHQYFTQQKRCFGNPIWIILHLDAICAAESSFPLERYAGSHISSLGECLFLQFADGESIILPPHSKLIINTPSFIVNLPYHLITTTTICTVNFSVPTVIGWHYSGWIRSVTKYVGKEVLNASLLFLTSSTSKVLQFLHSSEDTINHSSNTRINAIGCAQTVTTMLSAMVQLHSIHICTPIDMTLMKLFVVYALLIGFFFQMSYQSSISVTEFNDWYTTWMGHHVSSDQSSEYHLEETQSYLKNVIYEQSESDQHKQHDIMTKTDIDRWIKNTFSSDVLFFKNTSVFDCVPDPVEKNFARMCSIPEDHALMGITASRYVKQFGIMSNFAPFSQLILPTVFSSFMWRPVLLLNSSMIDAIPISHHYCQIMTTVSQCSGMQSTLSSHTLSSASHHLCPFQRHVTKHVYMDYASLGPCALESFKSTFHTFGDDVMIPKCPHVAYHVLVSPNNNRNDLAQANQHSEGLYRLFQILSRKTLATSEGKVYRIDGNNPTLIEASDSTFFSSAENLSFAMNWTVLFQALPQIADYVSLAEYIWNCSSLAESQESRMRFQGLSMTQTVNWKAHFHAIIIPVSIYLHITLDSNDFGISRPTIDNFNEFLTVLTNADQSVYTTLQNWGQLWKWEAERIYSRTQPTKHQANSTIQTIHLIHKAFFQTKAQTEQATAKIEVESNQRSVDSPGAIFQSISESKEFKPALCSQDELDEMSARFYECSLRQGTLASPATLAFSFLSKSPFYQAGIHQNLEDLVSTAHPLFCFDNESGTWSDFIRAGTQLLNRGLQMATFPSTHQSLISFIDILTVFLVDTGLSSLKRELGRLTQNLNDMELESGKSRPICPYTFEAKHEPPKTSYFTQKTVDYFVPNKRRQKELLQYYTVAIGKTDLSFRNVAILLHYIFLFGLAPYPVPADLISASEEYENSCLETDWTALCLYFYRRMSEALAERGLSYNPLQITGLFRYASEHTRLVFILRDISEDDAHSFFGPTFQVAKRLTPPFHHHESLKSMVDAIISPVLSTIPEFIANQQQLLNKSLSEQGYQNPRNFESAHHKPQLSIHEQIVIAISQIIQCYSHHISHIELRHTSFGFLGEDNASGSLAITPLSYIRVVSFMQFFAHFLVRAVQSFSSKLEALNSTITTAEVFQQKTEQLQQFLTQTTMSLHVSSLEQHLQDRLLQIEESINLIQKDTALYPSAGPSTTNETSPSVNVNQMNSKIAVMTTFLQSLSPSSIDLLRSFVSVSEVVQINIILNDLLYPDSTSHDIFSHTSTEIIQSLWNLDIFAIPLSKAISLHETLQKTVLRTIFPTQPPLLPELYDFIVNLVSIRIQMNELNGEEKLLVLEGISKIVNKNRKQYITTQMEDLLQEKANIEATLHSQLNSNLQTSVIANSMMELKQAESILSSLETELGLFKEEIENNKHILNWVIGDSILVASYLSLFSQLTVEQRKILLKDVVVPILDDLSIKHSEGFDPLMVVLVVSEESIFHRLHLDKERSFNFSMSEYGRSKEEKNIHLKTVDSTSLPDLITAHHVPISIIPTISMGPVNRTLSRFSDAASFASNSDVRRYVFDGSPTNYFYPRNSSDFAVPKTSHLLFSGNKRTLLEVLLQLMMTNGYIFSRIQNSLHQSTKYHVHPRLPFILDPFSIITPLNGSNSPPSHLYRCFGIRNPESSPNVISLNDSEALEKIGTLLNTLSKTHRTALDRQNSQPGAYSTVASKRLEGRRAPLSRQASFLSTTSQPGKSSLQAVLFLTDVSDQTISETLLTFLRNYLIAKYNQIELIGRSETSSNLSMQIPTPKIDLLSKFPAKMINVPRSLEIILIGSKLSTATFEGKWTEVVDMIPVVPTESIFQEQAHHYVSQRVSSDIRTLTEGSANQISDSIPLSSIALLHNCEKERAASLNILLAKLQILGDQTLFKFLTLPRSKHCSTIHLPPSTHFEELLDEHLKAMLPQSSHQSLGFDRSPTDTLPHQDQFPTIAPYSPFSGTSSFVNLPFNNNDGTDFSEISHDMHTMALESAPVRHSPLSEDDSNIPSFLHREASANLSVAHEQTPRSEQGDPDVEDYMSSLNVPEVMSRLTSLYQDSTNDRTTHEVNALVAVIDAERNSRRKYDEQLDWYSFCREWEDNNIQPFVEFMSIFAFGYLRSHFAPFSQNTPAFWNKLTFLDILHLFLAQVYLALDSAKIEVKTQTRQLLIHPAETGSTSSLSERSNAGLPNPQILPLPDDELDATVPSSARKLHATNLTGDNQTNKNRAFFSFPKTMKVKILQSMNHFFLSLIQQDTANSDDYTTLLFHLSCRLDLGTKRGFSQMEYMIYTFPHTFVVHDLDSALQMEHIQTTISLEPRSIFVIELVQLFLPLESGILQAAGLMPVNPAPVWLSTQNWKNIFTLAAICPKYRPFILDLSDGLSAIFMAIDKLPHTYPDPDDVLRSLLNPPLSKTSAGSMGHVTLGSVQNSLDKETALTIFKDSRYGNSSALSGTKADSILFHDSTRNDKAERIMTIMKQKRGKDKTDNRSLIKTDSDFHPFESTEVLTTSSDVLQNQSQESKTTFEHENSVSEHQTIIADHSYRQFIWCNWFTDAIPHLKPFPNAHMNELNILDRLLFFHAVKPEHCMELIQYHLSQSPFIGFETVFKDRQIKTLQTVFNELVLSRHSASQRRKNRVYLLLLQHGKALDSLSEDEAIKMIEIIARKESMSVYVFDVVAVISGVLKERRERLLDEDYWNSSVDIVDSVWEISKHILDNALKTDDWIVIDGLDQAQSLFTERLSEWIETNFITRSKHTLDKTNYLWILTSSMTHSPRSTPLNALSQSVVSGSIRAVILIPESFRTQFISTLALNAIKVSGKDITRLTKYYEPGAKKDSLTHRSLIHLIVCVSLLNSFFTVMCHILEMSSNQPQFLISNRTNQDLLNILTTPLFYPATSSSTPRSRGVGTPDLWILPVLEDNILHRVYPLLLNRFSQKRLSSLLRMLLSTDQLFNDRAVTIYPDIPLPSQDGFPHSLYQIITAATSSSINIHNSQSFIDDLFMHIPQAIHDSTVTDRIFKDIIGLEVTFTPFLECPETHVLVDTANHEIGIRKDEIRGKFHIMSNSNSATTPKCRMSTTVMAQRVVFNPILVNFMCKEINMFIGDSSFNIMVIRKAIHSIYMSDKILPSYCVMAFLELLNYNLIVSRIEAFMSHLPSIAMPGLPKTHSASSYTRDASYSFTVNRAYPCDQLFSVHSSSPSFIQYWDHLSHGLVPLQWVTLAPTALAIAHSPISSSKLPLVHQWLNRMVLVSRQWNQLFSFAPSLHTFNLDSSQLVTVVGRTEGTIVGKRLLLDLSLLFHPDTFLMTKRIEFTAKLNIDLMNEALHEIEYQQALAKSSHRKSVGSEMSFSFQRSHHSQTSHPTSQSDQERRKLFASKLVDMWKFSRSESSGAQIELGSQTITSSHRAGAHPQPYVYHGKRLLIRRFSFVDVILSLAPTNYHSLSSILLSKELASDSFYLNGLFIQSPLNILYTHGSNTLVSKGRTFSSNSFRIPMLYAHFIQNNSKALTSVNQPDSIAVLSHSQLGLMINSFGLPVVRMTCTIKNQAHHRNRGADYHGQANSKLHLSVNFGTGPTQFAGVECVVEDGRDDTPELQNPLFHISIPYFDSSLRPSVLIPS